MAEVENIAPETEAPKVASIGKPERFTVNFNPDVNTGVVAEEIKDTEPKVENALTDIELDKSAAPSPDPATAPAPDATQVTPTEEQIKAFFESKGIKYESIEKLKEKVDYEPKAELTSEQKEAQDKAMEDRIVDKFRSNGGKVEDFVQVKYVANADAKELALSLLTHQLKEEKFDDSQIEQILKDQYFQIDDSEIEQYTDESDKAWAKSKRELGTKNLLKVGEQLKLQAAGVLADLTKVIQDEDLSKQTELAISANIDEQFKSLPRKMVHQMGKYNGTEIPPVEYELSETDITEVKELLKDPAKRNNFIYNNDGTLNITNLSNVLIENRQLKSAVKAAYHEGGSRQAAMVEKVFGGSPYSIGVGGSKDEPNGKAGKATSYGKPQRVRQ